MENSEQHNRAVRLERALTGVLALEPFRVKSVIQDSTLRGEKVILFRRANYNFPGYSCCFCWKGPKEVSLYFLLCGHAACRECISNYITEFNHREFLEAVKQLHCKTCTETISLEVVREIVGPEYFDHLNAKASKMLAREFRDLDREEEKKRQVRECGICMFEAEGREVVTFYCGHHLCNECLSDYLSNLINSRRVSEQEVCCPQADCR